jgi:ferrous iron transport protein B
MYIKKAGTILLAVNVVLWALMYFPRLDAESSARFDRELTAAGDEHTRTEVRNRRRRAELAGSAAGRLGRAVEPVSEWAGFEWRENVALLGGLAAKEVVVGTLGTAYSMGDVDAESSGNLSQRLRADPAWHPLRAFTMMIFVMIYAPCVATLAVIRKETGSWKWAAFSTLYTTALAFAISVAVYQIGGLMGWGLNI